METAAAKTKMSIHRALSELKLIDGKIEKCINELVPTAIKQNNKKINDYIDEADFNKAVQGTYDSVEALIARKQAIKSLIVESNSKTKVTIGGKEYTVAEAITFKTIVVSKRTLVNALRAKHQSTVVLLNRNNETMKKNVDILLQNTFGKDHTKVSKDDLDAVAKPYEDRNIWGLVDPLKVEEKISKLESEINEFELNIDAVLSESNAITIIEI